MSWCKKNKYQLQKPEKKKLQCRPVNKQKLKHQTPTL